VPRGGAALWEARQQNLYSGKGMEVAAWLALELGLGHRRLERKRRRDDGRLWPLVKPSRRGGVAVEILSWGCVTWRRGWGGPPAQPVGAGV
jgi:hypothetical protein